MKKAVKVFGGLLLVLLFGGAVLLYVNTYRSEEEEETTKKEVSLKSAQQVFELGEDAEILGMIYNVSEAELIEDYDKIDAYFKAREYILSPKEYVKACVDAINYNDLFPGDVRFLRVKYSVTNNSEAQMDFTPDMMTVATITNGATIPCQFNAFDTRTASKDGQTEIELGGRKAIRENHLEDTDELPSYALSPGETIVVELMGEFHIYEESEMYIEDIIDTQDDSYDYYLMKVPSTQRIRLNIQGNYGTEGTAYAKVRNIQQMKCESWTNLERREWMTKWIEEELDWDFGESLDAERVDESSEVGQHFVEIFYRGTIGFGNEVVSGFCMESTMKNFQIVEWKDMPSVYSEQGYLQQMAEKYQKTYGGELFDMKVLLLDLTYVSSEIGELEPYYQKAVNYFYTRSNIYVKEEREDMMYWTGQADDWTVISDNKHPEYTGSMNLINMELGEVIEVQLAYVLPPALYEKYDALYFPGARYGLTYEEGKAPLTRIALK